MGLRALSSIGKMPGLDIFFIVRCGLVADMVPFE